ncbi:LLM class flavin-dependent oxidoreductase [Herbiconiux sp. KACC 21604]|uniref:LLM class flavin-dependent oxidoreductase n=1 Tax=unclassified Herbiconiux TaxID=2618217 RepID=UPI00149215B9|nr:LLM class flavin-dependent oxidoreductase [Herbiconiux sp. SALV-R1]QJU55205.1 LLM class flavin-dependent oxidoreductase [Herbiconiux sp. SALV-R1]WPO86370.1 LLM class flavin-dependent oxidoreductase [Herbiconiux sp. KACC 21604]
MPDYLHPLRFGSFITPIAAAPQHPVDLALLSEELGLDLVTFQDHPYQAAFQDTWTLLAWVAAKTSRIHVSGNVLNLPLRQPAVLARALASLDRLSGGRVELGIGTGGYFDAMATMGAPLLTPPEAVSALDEALDIIRGIWDTTDPTPLHVDGRYHRVAGAARGPAPAHDIPIWVGAYKPRMQRILGRKGDGWLPSLPWLKPGDIERGNQIIDDSARSAGRSPSDVTRLMNITPQYDADDLAELAVEHGVSVFILGSDDPRELERFAIQTAPRIRSRVETARRSLTRPAAASGPRSFQGEPLPGTLAHRMLMPGDRGYERYTSGYFRGARPGLVIRPESPAEVQDAVRFASRHRDLPLGLLSGGHGLSGRSLNDGGIVIALDALNGIDVSKATGARDGSGAREGSAATTVRVGPGARWGEVAKALSPYGLAITAGDFGGVGVGGLATTAGIGWFVRERGLTIDHLRAVELVTADGELVRASATENPDLFWAVRGAGANFGVVVSFEFEPHPVSQQVGFAVLVYTPDDVAAFLEDWGAAIENADPTVTGTLMIGPTGPGAQTVVQALIVVDEHDPDTVVERLQPFARLAPMTDQSVQLVPYAALLDLPGGEQHGRGEPHGHSGLVRHLDHDVAVKLTALLSSRSSFIVSIRSAGGAVAHQSTDAAAYAWRDANFLIAMLGSGTGEVEQRWAELVPALEGMYLSFETDTGPEVLARAFPPAHLERLRHLKAAWDPTGLFRDNFFIEPAPLGA